MGEIFGTQPKKSWQRSRHANADAKKTKRAVCVARAHTRPQPESSILCLGAAPKNNMMNLVEHDIPDTDAAKVDLINSFLGLMVWLDGRRLIDLLMPFQLTILHSVLATLRPDGAPWYKRGLIHVAKKNGKSLLLILASILVLHLDRSMGRKGSQVYYGASDEDLDGDNLTLAKRLYKLNHLLAEEVSIKANVIELRNGAGFIEIIPAGDAAGMHGKSYRLMCLDELHTQKNYDVLEGLEMDPARPDAQQLFGSYSPLLPRPGIPISDMLKQHADQVDPRLFVFTRSGDIEMANPAMGGPLGGTREEIESAQVRLPSWHFRRLYLNLSGQAEGAAFDGNAVEACISKNRKVLPPQPGVTYAAFTDISGGGADDSTLSIAHSTDDGRIIVDLVMDQGARIGGTFSPEECVKKFAAILKAYRCHQVTGDRFAGHWPREAFQKQGITYQVADQTASQLYAAFEPLVNSGQVELLDVPKLIQQILGLVRKGDKTSHQAGEHDDYANAVAGAAVLAAAPVSMPGIYVFD
ncbi:MAG: hypothetical protein U0361_01865 [Nitrospiraceae bacterium]